MLKIDRAVIEINGGCNYSCSMCPQDTRTGGRHKDFLRKMTLIEFESNVADCAKHGLRVVNLDGSGEATLNRNLPEYIKIVKRYGAKAVIFSNGYRMNGQFMRDCVDAGLDFFRFSIIGSNAQKYDEWMHNRIGGNFDLLMNNIREMKAYVDETGMHTCGCFVQQGSSGYARVRPPPAAPDKPNPGNYSSRTGMPAGPSLQ